jgi:hypothetical protein
MVVVDYDAISIFDGFFIIRIESNVMNISGNPTTLIFSSKSCLNIKVRSNEKGV